jgi:hypothetical protein
MEQVAQQGSPHHTEVRTHGGATQPVANPLEADIVAATEAGATMGEMAGVLRMAYGQPADPFGLLEDPI